MTPVFRMLLLLLLLLKSSVCTPEDTGCTAVTTDHQTTVVCHFEQNIGHSRHNFNVQFFYPNRSAFPEATLMCNRRGSGGLDCRKSENVSFDEGQKITDQLMFTRPASRDKVGAEYLCQAVPPLPGPIHYCVLTYIGIPDISPPPEQDEYDASVGVPVFVPVIVVIVVVVITIIVIAAIVHLVLKGKNESVTQLLARCRRQRNHENHIESNSPCRPEEEELLHQDQPLSGDEGALISRSSIVQEKQPLNHPHPQVLGAVYERKPHSDDEGGQVTLTHKPSPVQSPPPSIQRQTSQPRTEIHPMMAPHPTQPEPAKVRAQKAQEERKKEKEEAKRRAKEEKEERKKAIEEKKEEQRKAKEKKEEENRRSKEKKKEEQRKAKQEKKEAERKAKEEREEEEGKAEEEKEEEEGKAEEKKEEDEERKAKEEKEEDERKAEEKKEEDEERKAEEEKKEEERKAKEETEEAKKTATEMTHVPEQEVKEETQEVKEVSREQWV